MKTLSILPVLLLLGLNSLFAQVFFYSSDGGQIFAYDIPSGQESLLFTPDNYNPTDRIAHMTLDRVNGRIYFDLHRNNNLTKELRRIDYTGGNGLLIKTGLSISSMDYHPQEYKIYFTEGGGTVGDVGVSKIDLSGNKELIYECMICANVNLDPGSGKVYFQEYAKKPQRMNTDGSDLETLEYFPELLFGIGIADFSVAETSDKIYWIEYLNSLFINTTLFGASVNGSNIDTVFHPTDFYNGTIYSAPVIDEFSGKLYFMETQTDLFSEDSETFLKRSFPDSTEVETLLQVNLDALDSWAIDPAPVFADQHLVLSHNQYLPLNPRYDSYKKISGANNLPGGVDIFKLTADGSSASVFQINYSLGAPLSQNEFSLRIKEDPTGQNPARYGSFELLEPTQSNIIDIQYTHPGYINGGNAPAIINLELVNASDEVEMSVPIELYQPPLLLIHGLNSDPSIFNGMRLYLETALGYPDGMIIQADYEASNTVGFNENSYVLIVNRDDAISNANFNGIVTGKIDIVGHSMGGILSRLYLQGANYADDIHKLITLNTPHSGSNWGYVWAGTSTYCSVLETLFDVPGCNFDAIENLTPTSNAITQDLNGAYLNNKVVPSHAIITTVDPILNWLNLMPPLRLFLFGFDNHDYIVSASSQTGGLEGGVSSGFEGPHWGSYNVSGVKTKVKELISADPLALSFEQNGFFPEPLDPPGDIPPPPTLESISLSSTFEDQTITQGTQIDVSVTAASASDTILLIFNGNSLMSQADTVEYFFSGDISVQRNISSSRLGRIPVRAYAFNGSNNTLGVDSMFVKISTSETPVGFSSGHGAAFIGKKMRLPIMGHFQDEVLDISYDESLEIEFQNNFATQLEGGLILPQQAGVDSFKVEFNGLESQMFYLYIRDSDITGVKEVPSDIDFEEKYKIYPNPTDGNLTIQSVEILSGTIQLKVFNAEGKQMAQEKQLVNARQEFQLDVSMLPPGIYFLSIEQNGYISDLKFIKY
ncbi:MAG: T9SS type A sorting domain-containing protein [Bacteroidetes bacterium]|nr:T9SS type A sorting domain-containing protein [Bacteroidota bacterium]